MYERNVKTLKKILTYINKIESYMGGVISEDEFNHNSLVKDTVVFNLLQMRELSYKKLTGDFKKKYKNIPWKQIYGLGNRIVHDYDNVHLGIVYSTVKIELIALGKDIKQLLEVLD